MRAGALLLAGLLGGTVLGTTAAPAQAATPPALVVASTTTTAVRPGSTTTLTGMKVSGSGDEDGDDVTVAVSTDSGILKFPRTDGLTLQYPGGWSTLPSVTFSGTTADVNAALSAVQLADAPSSGTVKISVTALPSEPGYTYSAANGHFYRYVEDSGVSWSGASAQAEQLPTFHGQPAYLATLPSAEINDLAAIGVAQGASAWFGGTSDDTPSHDPARTWLWTGGPLRSTAFTYCSLPNGACDFVDDVGLDHAWGPGQPDNAGARTDPDTGQWVADSGEWRGVVNYAGRQGAWQDLPDAGVDSGDEGAVETVSGYLVEYGDQIEGATTFANVVTAASTVDVIGVADAPTSVNAARGNGSATITFAVPSDHGSAITGYQVTTGGGETVSCTASPCTVSGLTNGTSYTFTVVAVNGEGRSTASAPSNPVTPATIPGAPTAVAARGGDRAATISWRAPDDDGGTPVTGYTATATPGGQTVTCTASPCVMTGLSNGTDVTFSVVATNDVGRSASSEPSPPTLVVTVASAPTITRVEHGNASATVTFDPSDDDGGTAVTDYVVLASTTPARTTCPASPCTVTGLRNGQPYRFRVAARTAIGTGRSSAASDPVTPATVPDAPVDLKVVRDDGQAELTFGGPTSDGGAAVTAFEVSTDAGQHWTSLDTTGEDPYRATISGLVNGTSYTVAVRATNAEGHGAATEASNVTPAAAPGAPSQVTAVRSNGQVSVSFASPDDNGARVDVYLVGAVEQGVWWPCTASPCTVTGLTNGTAYHFAVRAHNAVGWGPFSEPSAAYVPATTPTAPVLRSVVSVDGGLVVTFTPTPASGDGGDSVTGYQYSINSSDWTSLPTSSASGVDDVTTTITGLANGRPATVSIRALNGIGDGQASAPLTETPATRPAQVRDVRVVVGQGSATVSWTAPDGDGGSPVVGYAVMAQPAGEYCIVRPTERSCTVDDLVPGTRQSFWVSAYNTVEGRNGTGISEPVVTDKTLITDVPDAPTGLSVRPGDRTLDAFFTVPTNDGGTPVTGYDVSTDAGRTWLPVMTTGIEADPTRRGAVVAGVLNGATFDVAVRARNGDGSGPDSTAVQVHTNTWFRDPVSNADRLKERPVPKHPERYHGKPVATTATKRAADGTPAVAASRLQGRQLQEEQAVRLGGNSLFRRNSKTLTRYGKRVVTTMTSSLTYVNAVTCEGYADYAGNLKHEAALAKARARSVCDEIRRNVPHVTSRTTTGYGATLPVVIGGSHTDRADNRRVIVLIQK